MVANINYGIIAIASERSERGQIFWYLIAKVVFSAIVSYMKGRIQHFFGEVADFPGDFKWCQLMASLRGRELREQEIHKIAIYFHINVNIFDVNVTFSTTLSSKHFCSIYERA